MSLSREEVLDRWERQHNTPEYREKVAGVLRQIEDGTIGEPMTEEGYERLKRSFLKP